MAYGLSGLTGLQRLDDQRHDVSDVLFGWTLGYVIGKWVTGDHERKVLGMDVDLLVDPELGTVGLSFSR